MSWLGRRVVERATREVGTVTADLPDAENDLLSVIFDDTDDESDIRWGTYKPNAHAKAELFELLDKTAE